MIAYAIEIEEGVIFQTNYNYTTNTTNTNTSTLTISDQFYLDSVAYCNSPYKIYFSTLNPCDNIFSFLVLNNSKEWIKLYFPTTPTECWVSTNNLTWTNMTGFINQYNTTDYVVLGSECTNYHFRCRDTASIFNYSRRKTDGECDTFLINNPSLPQMSGGDEEFIIG